MQVFGGILCFTGLLWIVGHYHSVISLNTLGTTMCQAQRRYWWFECLCNEKKSPLAVSWVKR